MSPNNVPEDWVKDLEVIVFRESIDLRKKRLEGLGMALLFKD